MNIVKKWWFWVLIIFFIAINLWVNRDQQDPSQHEPTPVERIGTH